MADMCVEIRDGSFFVRSGAVRFGRLVAQDFTCNLNEEVFLSHSSVRLELATLACKSITASGSAMDE